VLSILRNASLCFLALLATAGCGDDDAGGGPLDPSPVAGTSVLFELNADLTQPESFYDLPYPNDLRLDDDGHAAHAGFPIQAGNRVIRSVITAAEQRRLWPITPFAFFRFDAPLAERNADDWLDPRRDAPVLLIGIEPGSRDYARLLPTVASTLPADAYTPENLLAVSTPPGLLIEPRSTYAFVILRSLGDAGGDALGVPATFAQLRAEVHPESVQGARAANLYASLWPALQKAGISIADVAAATVFSTGDTVAELEELSDRLRVRNPVTIENLRVDADGGASHDRFCMLRGEASMPMFQRGIPPYNQDGRFELGDDGLPIVQREEIAPLVITLPRSPMPAGGYPLVLYFHGTDGLADQVVNRGPILEPGGERTPGEGPAHVLAPHGFATFGAALPLNPERYPGPPGPSERAYLNLSNLGAYQDTFRQMAIEAGLLLDALSQVEIDPAVVAACALDAPPAGHASYTLNTERVFAMGQSLGGQLVNMVGALDPRVAAIVPTGSGGHWSLTTFIAEFAPGVPAGPLVALLLGVERITSHLHPALQLVQSVFEPAEPLVFAARLGRDPLPGHPARSIYQPIGIDDPGFPMPIYAAMALATGTQQAGANLHPAVQRALALDELDGVLDYPVSGNGRSRSGPAYTGVVVEYESDGILDGHHIFAQLDEVKYQYGCFLRSLLSGGAGMVAQPAELGGECPR
jgi:hypothetical protein